MTIKIEAHYRMRDGEYGDLPTYATGTLARDMHGTPVLDLDRKLRTHDPRYMGRYSAAGSRNLGDKVVVVSPPATDDEATLIADARAAGFDIDRTW